MRLGRLEARAGSRTTSPPARLAAPPPMFLSRGHEQRGKEKQRRVSLVRRDQRGRSRSVKDREVQWVFCEVLDSQEQCCLGTSV
jgi:hypothetical protein